ncbi:3-phosphoshikimate 1-carboxyvinyltransferase [Micromonospora costi]|uniref:3-phosphoshikimate 1-carboxyvinyltransferase n=1 Tax=Micromonospora costi TaxID=1530042 RepID=UPI001F4D8D79|nr:3-phosphoshikimate 1-carboxyvinyltransferase [Micromonospora costi]
MASIAEDLPDVLTVSPLPVPPDTSVRPPGSKSITNRALLCASLAPGRSTLTGTLLADDTRAMLGAVRALGAVVVVDEASSTVTVTGADPRASAGAPTIDARSSGTTSRFILPAAALSPHRSAIDGTTQLRARPFGPVIEALRHLGATVEELGRPGFLPVAVAGPIRGGHVQLSGHLSSQFLSGLLMAGPLMRDGLDVELTSPLVSVPYLRMTVAVMAAFGVDADGLSVRPGSYRPTDYAIEPDASAASYFLAAAAITGGRITVEGLGTASLQGDVAFADVLERMGARVERAPNRLTVIGTGALHGIDVDMADISDTAQTLAAVAVFADTPTRIRGIGFIRGKETNRIAAVVTELRRAGIDATEHDDGFTVRPGAPTPTRFVTYDDHRMAMSLSLLGLRTPGIEIAEPGCVAKTYPGFFRDLDRLR